MIKRLLKGTNVAYFSLLGGVAISASVGLYSTLVIRSELPKRWFVLAISALIFAIAGWIWTLLGVSLGEIRGPIDNAPFSVTHDEREEAWKLAYEKKKKFLIGLLLSAVLLNICALIILPFGPLSDRIPKPESHSEHHLTLNTID